VHEVTIQRDVRYAVIDGIELALDLHLPAVADAPLVVYAHGGGFMFGDKSDGADARLGALARQGVAVASVNYRFVPQAIFPAQIHDLKGAVRWLRAHRGKFGLRTNHVAVWGASAGAYLATMVALSAGDPELEGDIGGNAGYSSTVQAAVVWFGPSDLVSSGRRSPLEKQIMFPPFEAAVLGVEDVRQAPGLAARANALARASRDAPPFLIAHGDSDRIVPVGESLALHQAIGRAGGTSTLALLAGAGHEDDAFDRFPNLAMTAAWLHSVLKPPGGKS
jgi:acetyl esterase/lipase